MFPQCLKLEYLQKAKLRRFHEFLIEKVGAEAWNEACEEGVAISPPIHYTVIPTGIGDIIQAESFGYVCDLTIDDDNNLSPDDFVSEGS